MPAQLQGSVVYRQDGHPQEQTHHPAHVAAQAGPVVDEMLGADGPGSADGIRALAVSCTAKYFIESFAAWVFATPAVAVVVAAPTYSMNCSLSFELMILLLLLLVFFVAVVSCLC